MIVFCSFKNGYLRRRSYKVSDDRDMNDDPSESKSLKVNSKGKRNRKTRKIVMRRLPQAMTWEELKVQLDPIPECEFIRFCPAEQNITRTSFARCYFAFKNDEESIPFTEKFNDYVFIDKEGTESTAIVEFAPNQKIPRSMPENILKDDKFCDTLESELDYIKFLEERENGEKLSKTPIDEIVQEIEEREKMAEANVVRRTPLTDAVSWIAKKDDLKRKKMQEARRERELERIARLRRAKEAKEKEAKNVKEFRNSRYSRTIEKSAKGKHRDYNNDSGDDSSLDRPVEHKESTKRSRSRDAEKLIENDKNEKKMKGKLERENKGVRRKDKKERDATRENDTGKTEVVDKDSGEDKAETLSTKKKESLITKKKESFSTKKKEVFKSRVPSSEGGENADEVSSNPKEVEEKPVGDAPKRRRNKERPERAIYQPAAAARRRLAAAAAAAAASCSQKEEP